MSNARGNRGDDKQAFLTQNPNLIEYDTNISVVDLGGIFNVAATDGLGQPLPVSLRGAVPGAGSTLAKEVDLTDGTLSVTAPVPSHPSLDPFITLSDRGFGVFSENDVPLENTYVLNNGEALGFEVNDSFCPSFITLNGGFMTNGITDLLIEYEVLNDEAGTITLEFDNAAPPLLHLGNGPLGPTPPEVVNIATGSENSTGFIEVDAPYGMPFGGWEFTVDGDVNVAVTGISYGTNFDGGILI